MTGIDFTRGLDYLCWVQRFALVPLMVDVMDNLRDRQSICTWIGGNIQPVNATLTSYLKYCQDCFHPQQQRPVQIFAVPLAAHYRIDGLCNVETQPVTILVDPGRVVIQDWLGVVAHEYAHALRGSSGHDRQYWEILSHLCLGLGLIPPWEQMTPAELRSWPHCRPMADPLAFWRGQG